MGKSFFIYIDTVFNKLHKYNIQKKQKNLRINTVTKSYYSTNIKSRDTKIYMYVDSDI